MRIVVVGGGIIGLAVARLASLSDAGAEVVVLEREARVALHQTGRNSGVVHAGLYYAPGTLKARLCRRGIGLMKEFCLACGVAYEECGKLVVAVDEGEVEPLRRLVERAAENGVPGLRWLSGAEEIAAVEPAARGVAALHSPQTAITDFAAVARALAGAVSERGGSVRTDARVVRVDPAGRVQLADGSSVPGDRVIVCAGLAADRLARASGEPAAPRIVPFRGGYWQLRAERAGLVRGLIYPVPDPALPFLGVHLTRTVDGRVLIGPNALPIGGLAWAGAWRMMRRHWRAGLGELARSASRRRFVGEAARYVPALSARDVEPAPAGVRAQAVDRDGTLVDDFRLAVSGKVVWVRNAPSPGATSSLAIAEELLARAGL